MEIKNISERSSFVENEKEISIVIIANTDRMKITNILVILSLWLAGGGVVIWNYFGMTDEKTKIITIVWIAFWGYFAYIMIKGLLWMWRGREIIKIRNGELHYKRDVNGRGWVQSFPLGSIRGLKSKKDEYPSWIRKFGADYWSTDCDSIRFESGDREIALGFKLNENETNKIVGIIRKNIR